MTDVIYSTVLDVPVNKTWEVVRDFGGLPRWFPFVSKSVLRDGARPTETGAVRDNTVDKGAIISERLVELSDRNRRLAYELIAGDVPMTDYSSVLILKEVLEGDRTFAVWTARSGRLSISPSGIRRRRRNGCETGSSGPAWRSWREC